MSSNDTALVTSIQDLPPEWDALQGQNRGRKLAFLRAYATTGGVMRACEIAGISVQLHYVWLKRDQVYAAAYQAAWEMAGDMLEQEAFRRAVAGCKEDVYFQGIVVGQKVVYSDGLLKVLLRGAKPDRYRENLDITTAGAGLRIVLDTADQPPMTFSTVIDESANPAPAPEYPDCDGDGGR